jgi:transposase
MPYISGFDRDQLLCCSWNVFVDKKRIARLIDAFVNHLDIEKYGVKSVSIEGPPAYGPKSLISCIFMGAEKKSGPRRNWQKTVK